MSLKERVGELVSRLQPSMGGAIDIMCVRQPDGSLKSSPFYVRFGDWLNRPRHRDVSIKVNQKDAPVKMALGRTGNAYFLQPVREGEDADVEDLDDAQSLTGMVSPPSGYSSDTELPHHILPPHMAQVVSDAAEDMRRDYSHRHYSGGTTPKGSHVRRDDPNWDHDTGTGFDDAAPLGGSPPLTHPLGFDAYKRGMRAASGMSSPQPSQIARWNSGSEADNSGTGKSGASAPRSPAGALPPGQLTQAIKSAQAEQEGPKAAGGEAREEGDGKANAELETERRSLSFAQMAGSMANVPPAQPVAAIAISGAKDKAPGDATAEVATEGPPAPEVPNDRPATVHGAETVRSDGSVASTKPTIGMPRSPSDIPTQGAPILEVSLCHKRLLELSNFGTGPSVSEEAATKVFEAHRVPADNLLGNPAGPVGHPDLMCRAGGCIVRWSSLVPLLACRVAFGPPAAVKLLESMSTGGEGLEVWAGTVAGLGEWLVQPWGDAKGRGDKIASGETSKNEDDTEDEGPRGTNSGGWLRIWPFNSTSEKARGDNTSIRGTPPTQSELRSPQKSDPEAQMPTSPQRTTPPEASPEKEAPGRQASQKSPAGEQPVPGAGGAHVERGPPVKKMWTPSATMLEWLGTELQFGQNDVSFHCNGREVRAYIYLLDWTHKIIISDIDGTITKSDTLGHVFTLIGRDWTHGGIADLFQCISKNGYSFMYLSSRAIAQASMTRDFLHNLRQGSTPLPLGPVILSPDGLMRSLTREVILRRPHEFKMAALRNILDLFPEGRNPFYAGFGNRHSDEVSYMDVGITPGRVFTINPRGKITKMTNTQAGAVSSLGAIKAHVDDIFPALHVAADGVRGGGAGADGDVEECREEFNHLNYWGPAHEELDVIGSDGETGVKIGHGPEPEEEEPASSSDDEAINFYGAV
ncbi:unnamed protein product [Pedinophyceae sp. YPF-701]|nr:unnamed protein product [Pedinophyceae sp. YPF-701]